MAITKDINRQCVMSALLTLDFGVGGNMAGLSGSAQAAFSMPPNCIVTGGAVVTRTAVNSATSDVISVGDALSANRYLNAANIHAAGISALVPTGYLTPGSTPSSSGDITVTWTGVGAAPTVGQVQVRVDYVQVGRGEYTQD